MSFCDVVGAEILTDGNIRFRSVVIPGGHSTYQVLLSGTSATDLYIEELRKLGCGVEHFTPNLKGIDVPPESDIFQVYALLKAGMAAGAWTFDELRVEHPV